MTMGVMLCVGYLLFSIFGFASGESIDFCSCGLFCSVGGVWGDASDIDIELLVSDGNDDIDAVFFVWVCGGELLFRETVEVVSFGFMVDGVCTVVVSQDGSTSFVAGRCVLAIFVEWLAALWVSVDWFVAAYGVGWWGREAGGGGIPGRPGNAKAKFDCGVKVGCGHFVVVVGRGK